MRHSSMQNVCACMCLQCVNVSSARVNLIDHLVYAIDWLKKTLHLLD